MNLNSGTTMKALAKFLVAQLCCASLFVTDALALGGGKKDRGSRGGGSSSARKISNSSSRPSVQRNPVTQSRVSPVSRPSSKPEIRPATRPSTKPSRPSIPSVSKPSTPKPSLPKPSRPEVRPTTKPGNVTFPKPDRPVSRPGGGGDKGPGANRPPQPNRPGGGNNDRPGVNRPGGNNNDRPGINRPGDNNDRPGGNNNRPGINRPGSGNDNRPQINRPDRKPEIRPGKNTKPVRRPDFDRIDVNKGSGNNWWSNNRNSNNSFRKDIDINNRNRNITINNNFKQNVNWSTNRKNWGYNPWWNRPATRPWYGGSWNCGWNNRYRHHHSHYYYGGYRPLPGYVYYDDDDDDWAKAVGWGLVGWGLGSMIFNSGYQTYSNPYRAEPVVTTSGSRVTYSEPITVVAAQSAPTDDKAAELTAKSESFIADSQQAFRTKDYLTALDLANKAVAEAPGDGALHEYRALVLFALGKFSEAAGVLNPVLAGGPGWDWTTMISLYDSQETYSQQLKNLETYVGSKSGAADGHFLLGYHYMVCGHLEDANAEFAEAAKQQPADTVSAQLRDLTAASSNGEEGEDAEVPVDAAAPVPEPVAVERLAGTWVSDKGEKGKVTLAFKEDGKFSWTFAAAGKSNEFGGDYSMNDNGLLVLDAEESQMVASIEMPQDKEMKFVLAGGPPGDPGLSFSRQ